MQVSRYVLAWLAVTILVTAAAWAVVATASDQVNDTPVAPIIDGGAIAGLATTTTALPGSTSTTSAPSTGEGSPGSSGSTTTPGDSSSTSATVTISSTTVPDGTSTTSSSTASGTKTVTTTGGTVTVSYSNGNVSLDGATPALGYSMDVELDGPEKVRVDFEGAGGEFSVQIEWKDGQLDIKVEE